MGKYTTEVQELLEHIGGKENIATVSHCATRLRFVLKDNKKADMEKVEAIKIVKGSFTQAGQFQIIIGNEVSTFYNELIAQANLDKASKEEAKVAARQNLTLLQRVISHLGEIFSPLIPAIVVGGLILGFRNVIGDINMMNGGTQTLTQVSQFWAGVHHFLWLIGEAIFFFLPVGITWSISKKMGTTQILGIVLGITLVSPQLLNAYAVAGGEIPPVWDFGFAQVNMIGYQAQVIPAILAGFLLANLELKIRDYVPSYVSMIALSNIAQGSAVLAMIYLNKENEEEKQVSIPAAISCFLGVTEPAMFGINLKYVYPFLAAMIGSSLAGVFSVATGVMANSIGVGGLPGILSIQPAYMISFAISMLIALAVPFAVTVFFNKRNITFSKDKKKQAA